MLRRAWHGAKPGGSRPAAFPLGAVTRRSRRQAPIQQIHQPRPALEGFLSRRSGWQLPPCPEPGCYRGEPTSDLPVGCMWGTPTASGGDSGTMMSTKRERAANARDLSDGVHARAPGPRARSGGSEPSRKTVRSEMVATLQFTCEPTGGLVTYELPNDATTVKDLWSRRLMLNCPHCDHVHSFAFRQAFMRGALEIRRTDSMRVSDQMARRCS
jgi:hypothetical protein